MRARIERIRMLFQKLKKGTVPWYATERELDLIPTTITLRRLSENPWGHYRYHQKQLVRKGKCLGFDQGTDAQYNSLVEQLKEQGIIVEEEGNDSIKVR